VPGGYRLTDQGDALVQLLQPVAPWAVQWGDRSRPG